MGLAAVTGKRKFTGRTALFQRKARYIAQWNHMRAGTLAGSPAVSGTLAGYDC